MSLLLLIILILLVVGALPNLGFHSYGYAPSGIVGGAAHCRPRAAPHRPTLMGTDRPGRQVSGADSRERIHDRRLERCALPDAHSGARGGGSLAA